MRQGAQEHPAISHNRQAWEEIAASHAEELLGVVAENLHRNPTRYLEEPLRRALDTVGVEGSVLAQFNCNNGRELISAVNHGARAGYGFDISSNYIEQARWLAANCGTNATFVANDITALDHRFDGVADIVFATGSALCWLPDLVSYFSVARRVLGGEGTLILYETHPFAEMLKPDVARSESEPLVPHYSYNTGKPVLFRSEGEYFGDGNDVATYWYHHSLSYIVQSALNVGFTLRQFEEYDHDVCVGYRDVEKFDPHPPLSMLLRFTLEQD
jgi:SAM-dependent methyltransferase